MQSSEIPKELLEQLMAEASTSTLPELLNKAYRHGRRDTAEEAMQLFRNAGFEVPEVPGDHFKLSHTRDNANIYTESDIDVIGLTERPRNCLRRAQIETLGQLIDWSARDMFRITNFGQLSLNEIVEKFVALNLRVPDTWRDSYTGSIQVP